ncbi:MAG: class I SAM-dependent methyltransferase [Bryobacterales bacterium]|nr:class I SAM-dependent methyltransferase [Bryobacterales bacterium]
MHRHVGAVVAAEINRFADEDPVRILDIGCGDGRLLLHLYNLLKQTHPDLRVELYGLDITDPGVQNVGFIRNTRTNLQRAAPEVDWGARLKMVAVSDPWPFPPGCIHIAVSNQVCEHVRDHRAFFGETFRSLVDGGISVHVFPLKHYLLEEHLLIPLVHRINNHDLLRHWIRAASLLGIGKYRQHRRLYGHDVATFAARHADYIMLYTNYLSARQLASVVKACSMRLSFRYTIDLYLSKALSLLGFTQPRAYRRSAGGLCDWLACWFLRYLSSVTVFLEKSDAYNGPGPNANARHMSLRRHLVPSGVQE